MGYEQHERTNSPVLTMGPFRVGALEADEDTDSSVHAGSWGDGQGEIRLAIKAELDLVAGLDLSKVPEAERTKGVAEGLKRLGPALQRGKLSVGDF